MTLPSVLSLPAAALRLAAGALRLLAHTSERAADVLSGGRQPHQAPRASAARSAPQPSPPPRHAPTPGAAPADVPALASRTAREVIASLDGLSMSDLAELQAYESRHRRRRTVLEAIDRAVVPPPDAREESDESLDDVRSRDDVVYTTQTPAR